MKYLITAFGGGHTSLALACKDKIKGNVVFLTLQNDDLSKKKISALHLRHHTVIEPRQLGESLTNPTVWLRFGINVFQSFKILLKERPDVIVSTGPNPSIPISLLAKLFGTKLINVEVIDRVTDPSLTARFLSFFADETWVHWKKQREWFKNAKLVGPLFFEQKSGIKITLSHPIFAVFSGRMRYQDLLDAVDYVDQEINCSWIIQTAGGTVSKKNEAIIQDYFVGISDLLLSADIVIATGGLTAFEALAMGKLLILYPRKDTLDEHQIKQALILSQQKTVWYVKNREELKGTLLQIQKRY